MEINSAQFTDYPFSVSRALSGSYAGSPAGVLLLLTGWLGGAVRTSKQRRRLELELGTGGDHDVPYTFALPPSMPQVLAWMRLLARVQRRQKQQSREDCISVGDIV